MWVDTCPEGFAPAALLVRSRPISGHIRQATVVGVPVMRRPATAYPSGMPTTIHARAASEGLAFGVPVRVGHAEVPDDLETSEPFATIAGRTAERLDTLAAETRSEGREEEADVLEAYALIATDPALAKDVAAAVDAGTPLVAAIRASVARMSDTFAAMEDEYFAQRADDVRGVGRELLATIAGIGHDTLTFPAGAIIVADDLTPADTVRMDLSRIGAFATERGGPTSHTAIVARAAAIPAIVGATGILAAVEGVALVMVDGDRGLAILDPDEDTRRDAELRMGLARDRVAAQRQYRGRAVSFDGEPILVAANIGNTGEIAAAVEAAADGVGLFRSEFLFLGRDRAPTGDEQAAAYRAAVEAFTHPTIIRTLDIGGDKEVPYLDLPAEQNPFLGVRGLRLCLQRPEIFATQLDALLSVEDPDRLRIMFPMVATPADFDAGLARVQERASILGVVPPPVGVMIETTSAALLAPHLARRAAFFSIGTNDLTQYVTAADRTHGDLGAFQDAANPAVLQLIHRTTTAAAAAGIPTGVCGEAAGDPALVALLVGLGVTELSVAPVRIDPVRWLVDQLDPVAVRAAARDALDLPDADAVRERVAPLLP